MLSLLALEFQAFLFQDEIPGGIPSPWDLLFQLSHTQKDEHKFIHSKVTILKTAWSKSFGTSDKYLDKPCPFSTTTEHIQF